MLVDAQLSERQLTLTDIELVVCLEELGGLGRVLLLHGRRGPVLQGPRDVLVQSRPGRDIAHRRRRRRRRPSGRHDRTRHIITYSHSPPSFRARCCGFIAVELSDAGFKIANSVSHFSDGACLARDDVIVLVATATRTDLAQFRRRRRLATDVTRHQSITGTSKSSSSITTLKMSRSSSESSRVESGHL